MSDRDDPFFVGWSDKPLLGRRSLIAAGVGLVAAGAGGATLLSMQQAPPGGGAWDQSHVTRWSGKLIRTPYPHLLMAYTDGTPRTAFLATNGKISVTPRLPEGLEGFVNIRASAIARGQNLMLAVVDGPEWIEPMRAPMWHWLTGDPADFVKDLGPATLIGEILDAKCWFGAMRPGFGKTHKSCAALCARGGLPLAFCAADACGDDARAPLFLDETGAAHGREIIPFVADAVMASGRLMRVGDVTQYRVARADIRRL